MRHFLLLIPVLVLLTPNISGSYAYNLSDTQAIPITISTDKREYSDSDLIFISGSVRTVTAKTPLTIEIFNMDNNLVHVEQIDVAKDGTYTLVVKIEGDLWKKYGTYMVNAQYGYSLVSTRTSFDLLELDKPSKQMFHLVNKEGQGSYDITYKMSGGTISNMTVDFPSLALVLSINATKNGAIELDIPRDFMDAKRSDGSDEKFITLINGNEHVPYDEQDSPTHRNMTINFLKDDTKIELIGTQIVPEFGSLAGMIIAISIIGVIVISTRFRFIQKV
jgi:hypothetical protein